MENTKSLLMLGNCLDRLKDLEDNSVDAICTDPPYGFGGGKTTGFMGKEWDRDVPSVAIWQECLRVLKPGGSLLAFAGTRTQHRMAINIEDAGFVLKDVAAWVYGCLSEDTLAITPEGPKSYKDLKVGDAVMGYNIETWLAQKVEIQEIVEYDYDEDAYLIEGNDGTQLVSRNHRVICIRDNKLSYVMAEFLNEEEKIPFYASEGLQVIQDVKISKVPYKGKVWCLRVPTGAFVAVRHGVAFPTGNSGFPKSLNVAKALRKMGNVPEETIQKWEGWGTATKPAYEPNTWAVKPAAAIMDLQHNLGDVVCLSLAHANNVERLLVLNPQEQIGIKCVSALMLAAVNRGRKSEELSDLMDMFRSPEMGRTILSIAESWKIILAGSCLPENMSITKTESSLITELKTLNSWTLQNILGGTADQETLTSGGFCNASSVGRILNVATATYRKETFAQELALLSTDLEHVSNAVPNLEESIAYLDSALKNVAQEIKEKLSKVNEPVFKYCAKAAKKDRNYGLANYMVFRFPVANLPANLSELNNLTEDDGARWAIDDKKENVMVICPKDNLVSLLNDLRGSDKPEGIDNEANWEPLTNQHATVKPNELMRWLCKMVTPEGGTILDPFMGSGSTGVAALQEGFEFIGIEMEPSYLEIAKLRINNA